MSNGDQGSVIAEIDGLVAEAEALKESDEASRSREHQRWRIGVASLLDRWFGPSSRYGKEFASIGWSGPQTVYYGTDELAYPHEMEQAIAVLLAARDEAVRQGSREVHKERDARPAASGPEARRVFVVHGRDEAVKNALARFLAQIGLEPVILHEEPDQGRTIIEKFEKHAAVAYAVVVCTGDDEGRRRETEDELMPRARQNVIMELGYFMGTLGRHRVSVLYHEGVEMPSDYSGVLYIPMDVGGQWKARLVRELRSADVPVNAEAALGAL